MLKEIAGTRAYNILKKRKMETVEDVCQLFPSKYYDFSFINPLNTGRLDKNYAFVSKDKMDDFTKMSFTIPVKTLQAILPYLKDEEIVHLKKYNPLWDVQYIVKRYYQDNAFLHLKHH